jgi:hypothetical protein
MRLTSTGSSGYAWFIFGFKREEVLGSRVSVPKSPLLFISNELILTFLLLNSNQLKTSFKQPLTCIHEAEMKFLAT